jgi:hypothetical protein
MLSVYIVVSLKKIGGIMYGTTSIFCVVMKLDISPEGNNTD